MATTATLPAHLTWPVAVVAPTEVTLSWDEQDRPTIKATMRNGLTISNSYVRATATGRPVFDLNVDAGEWGAYIPNDDVWAELFEALDRAVAANHADRAK